MMWRSNVRHFFQSTGRVGDVSDKLNSTWSVLLLVLLSAFAYYQTFEKQPVTCWCPAEFKSSMVEYTNKACWEQSYYYLPLRDDIPMFKSYERRKMWKPNYKWLPLILAIQALLFKLPDLIHAAGQSQTGLSIHKVLGLTEGYYNFNFNERISLAKQVGKYLKNWLNSCTVSGVPWGPLTLLYFFVKICYFVNSVTQLALLDKYLKAENETSYMSQLANDIASNETSEWRSTNQTFPREFLCVFAVQKLSSRQDYTVQCVLNVATFYEGLYGFLWIWLLVTTVASSFSLGWYGLKILLPCFRTRYVRRYLALTDDISPPPQDHMMSEFAGSQVTEDGVYILKSIGEISSEHLVRDVLVYLWNAKYHPALTDSHAVASDTRQSELPSAPFDTSRNYGRGGAIIAPPPAHLRHSEQPAASGIHNNEAIPLMENTNDNVLYPSIKG